MATITIRNLDEETKRRLRIRAAEKGRSMEEEARDVLDRAVELPAGGENLGQAIRSIFEPLGGAELEPLPFAPLGLPPDLDR
jgi:plasmid stability protein